MNIPLVPLRDVVIFPGVVTPLFVGRESSINSLQKAMSDDKSVMLVAQREANTENPSQKDLYEIGTVSTILRIDLLIASEFLITVISLVTGCMLKDKLISLNALDIL